MTKASDIARHLGSTLEGNDVDVTAVCSLGTIRPNAIGFMRDVPSDEVVKKISDAKCVMLAPQALAGKLPFTHIPVANPRLAFARTLAKFFETEIQPGIDPTARVSTEAKIGRGVAIGAYSIVGPNVVIGDGTVIRNHVVIHRNASIGKQCLVKSHAIIGEEGFGFEKDETGNHIRIPHIGGVLIGNHVEVGCYTTVCSGTIDATVVGDHVKLDDHVHVAHNCHVGPNTTLAAGAVLAGSVIIGKGSEFGPNACVLQGIRIGAGALIGIGAVLLRDAEEKSVFAPNPAKRIPTAV